MSRWNPVTWRWRRIARRTAFSCLILFVLVLTSHLICTLYWGRELAVTLAEMQAKGLPMRAEQVIPPAAADADNAALIYRKAYAVTQHTVKRLDKEFSVTNDDLGKLQRLKDSSYKTGDPSAWIEKYQSLALAILDSPAYDQLWTLINEAASLPRCRFDIFFPAGPMRGMPQFTEMRALVDYNIMRIDLRRNAGRFDDAWKQIPGLLRLSDSLREDPTLLSMLMHMSLRSRALRTLQRLIVLNCADERVLGPIAAELDRLSNTDLSAKFRKSLDAERILLGEWCFAHPEYLAWSNSIPALSDWPLSFSGQLKMFAKKTFLVFWSSPIGTPLRLKERSDYLRVMSLARDSVEDADRLQKTLWMPTARSLLPSLISMKASLRSDHELMQLGRMSVGIRRFQSEHGRFPDLLEDLSPRFLPEVPKRGDGQPFAYRIDQGTAVLEGNLEAVGLEGDKKPRPTMTWRLEP